MENVNLDELRKRMADMQAFLQEQPKRYVSMTRSWFGS